MNHEHLPAVDSATLPASYENAKNALATCSSMDECKDWADKAKALASYARQSQDESLSKMATRIRARAIRRAGELLKQIEPAKNQHDGRGGASPSRKQAGDNAGFSDDQRKDALRVASVPDTEFTDLVESENPPTVTKLAEMGTKKQLIDLQGRDPKHFNTAMHFLAKFRHHLKDCEEYDIAKTVDILTDDERNKLRDFINQIDAIHDQIMTRI